MRPERLHLARRFAALWKTVAWLFAGRVTRNGLPVHLRDFRNWYAMELEPSFPPDETSGSETR